MKKIVLSMAAIATVAMAGGDIVPVAPAAEQESGSWFDKFEKSTPIFTHSSKLKYSGQIFLGYKNVNYDDNTVNENDQAFQVRRGYFQVKAYLLDDPKSYYRVTLDMKQNGNFDGGSLDVRAKYAYLNLNEVLPATSFEIGLAHRPWHDYEEHNSWLYRSISEVLIENHNSAHLSSSADYGVMAKTRTKFLDTDIGVFNGEGYHGKQNSDGMSFEWRATAHLLGTHGHPDKNTYLDASFFGQLNQKHSAVTDGGVNYNDDLHFYGVHAVYNMPSFLVSAQYVSSDDTSDVATHTSKGSGKGYSANAEFRLGDDHQYKIFGKYDNWTPDVISGATEYTRITEIFGVAWKQNKNVEWVANATINDNDNDHYNGSTSTANGTSLMLTAEINF